MLIIIHMYNFNDITVSSCRIYIIFVLKNVNSTWILYKMCFTYVVTYQKCILNLCTLYICELY